MISSRNKKYLKYTNYSVLEEGGSHKRTAGGIRTKVRHREGKSLGWTKGEEERETRARQRDQQELLLR